MCQVDVVSYTGLSTAIRYDIDWPFLTTFFG